MSSPCGHDRLQSSILPVTPAALLPAQRVTSPVMSPQVTLPIATAATTPQTITDLVTAPPQSKRPGPCLSTNQHRQRPKTNTKPSINRLPSAQPVQSFCFSYKVVKKNRPALRFDRNKHGARITRVDASLAKQHPQLQVGRIVYRINTTGSRASPVSADVAKSILEQSGDFTVHTATQ